MFVLGPKGEFMPVIVVWLGKTVGKPFNLLQRRLSVPDSKPPLRGALLWMTHFFCSAVAMREVDGKRG